MGPGGSVGRLRFFFFFNDTATTEIYTLSLHDALPISVGLGRGRPIPGCRSRSTASSTVLLHELFGPRMTVRGPGERSRWRIPRKRSTVRCRMRILRRLPSRVEGHNPLPFTDAAEGGA